MRAVEKSIVFYSVLASFFGPPLIKSAPFDSQKHYDGYAVLRLTPKDQEHLDYLRDLWQNDLSFNLDFWHAPSRVDHDVDVLVSPTQRSRLEQSLAQKGIPSVVAVDDVQELIQREKGVTGDTKLTDVTGTASASLWERVSGFFTSTSSRRSMADSPVAADSYRLDRFNRYDDIVAHMRDLVARYPTLMAVEKIGQTNEGRSIILAKITGARSTSTKPAMWIDGGIHAREWISPAVATYFIDRLVTKYSSDPDIKSLVDNMDWYILPVLNPDGYEYSQTTDRMWRKNRSKSVCTGGSFFSSGQCCQGTDLNRNFDWHWGSTGSSPNPCKEIYAGDKAFSEPESDAVRKYVQSKGRTVKGFITLHSYSQMWLVPYGHQQRSYPSDYYSKLLPVARRAVQALRSVYGTTYQVGTGADLMYEAAGGSEDWAKGALGIDYPYLLEMRPTDRLFNNGFILPTSEILPTGEETFAGIKVVAKQIIAENPISNGFGGQVSTTGSPFGTRLPIPTAIGGGISNCVDSSRYCSWWKLFGRCNVFSIRTTCMKSCSQC